MIPPDVDLIFFVWCRWHEVTVVAFIFLEDLTHVFCFKDNLAVKSHFGILTKTKVGASLIDFTLRETLVTFTIVLLKSLLSHQLLRCLDGGLVVFVAISEVDLDLEHGVSIQT